MVERRIFDALATLKESIDAKELQRFSDKLELKRRKDAQRNDAILECMIERTLHGASPQDLQVKAITVGEIRSAARTFLPSHKAGYVRLTFVGR